MVTTLIAILFSLACEAQTINDYAHLYGHDLNGNRVSRKHMITLIQAKRGGKEVDTLHETFGAEKKDEFKIVVYPNPTASAVIVESLSWIDNQNANVKIYDMSGKYLTEKTLTSAKEILYLGTFAAGMYQMQYFLNNKLVTTWKIVKK